MSRVRAPDLPQTAVWLNRERPLSLKDLRGQVVLLDFWTYGCINCLHVLPDLHHLETKYGNRLTIIGIHTAKFEHEGDPASVQQAILRYGIAHAVLIDPQRYLWDQYAVKAWPTFIVIDPQGYIAATVAGEGQRQVLDTLIEGLLAARPADPASPAALPALTAPQILTPLAFPGKVLADAHRHTLFIADTAHHRIVVTGLDGTPQAAIGTGQAGWNDGPADEAQFSSPQGMALSADGKTLYIADSGNHLLRQIDLPTNRVTTLAGTGQQSPWLFPHGGKARETALNSPWDVVRVGDRLYGAIAGAHQIWQLDLTQNTVETYLGTGAEFGTDGGRGMAAFAQPSGLATDGSSLFVADSETSSIRTVTLADEPYVQTLCGSGQLFEFGDVDGAGDGVRLQHCLGIAYTASSVWIADTYNHKIKQINPATGECRTVAGDGQPGHRDGVGTSAQFAEPSGLTATHEALYIADTNNHAIRRLDLASQEVTTLPLPGLCSPLACSP